MAALLGGFVGWSLAFAGLGVSGLFLGFLAMVGVLWLAADRSALRRHFGLMLGFAIAFVLLTWPILWVGIGYLRFLITGEALGN